MGYKFTVLPLFRAYDGILLAVLSQCKDCINVAGQGVGEYEWLCRLRNGEITDDEELL